MPEFVVICCTGTPWVPYGEGTTITHFVIHKFGKNHARLGSAQTFKNFISKFDTGDPRCAHLLLVRRRGRLEVPAVPRDLHDRVLRDVDGGALLPVLGPIPQQIGAEHAERRLMRDDEKRLLVGVEPMCFL